MNTQSLAKAYYAKINAKDLDGVLSLFAEGASFTLPDGRIVSGVEAIKEMYQGVFAHGGPQPQPKSFVSADRAVAVEVEVQLADGSVRQMASFFHVDEEGQFTRIGVYQRASL